MHVDAGDARMNDTHRHLPHRPPILRYGRAARGARNKIKILRHALAAAIRGPHRAGSSVNLQDRHVAPSTNDVSGRRSPKFHPSAGVTSVT